MNDLRDEKPEISTIHFDISSARRDFSQIGWAFLAFEAASLVCALFISLVLQVEKISDLPTIVYYILNFLPMYTVGFAVLCFVLSCRRAYPPKKQNLGAARFIVIALISFAVMVVGSYIGNILNDIIGSALGHEIDNSLDDMVMNSDIWVVLIFVVIVGPFFEELMCRKLVIDRIIKHGDGLAVAVSALVFGLLHGNFYQFFYTFGMGLLLGYVYVKTGKLRYSYLLHMLFNFNGSIIPLLLTKYIDINALETLETAELLSEHAAELAVYMIYILLYFGLAIAGLVLAIIFRKEFRFEKKPTDIPRSHKFRTAILNPGMIIMTIAFLGLFAESIFL